MFNGLSIASQMSKLILPDGYELQACDIGKLLCQDFGIVVASDVGRKVYLRQGLLCMESREQKNERLGYASDFRRGFIIGYMDSDQNLEDCIPADDYDKPAFMVGYREGAIVKDKHAKEAIRMANSLAASYKPQSKTAKVSQ